MAHTFVRRVRRSLAAAALLACLGASVASAAGYRDEVVADSPSAYWRLGETSGTVAANEVAGQAGTYVGGPALGQPGALAGDANAAAVFDGLDDAVTAAPSATLDAIGGVTVELWARRTRNASWQVLVGKPGDGQSRNENYAIWFDSSNRLQAYFGNGTSYVSAAWGTPVDNGWHHIAATYDNSTARLYVDGVQRAQATSSVALTPVAASLNIGRSNSGSYFFAGTLDEVAIYRSVLSPTRIAAHYAAASVPVSDTTAPSLTIDQPTPGATIATPTTVVSGTAGTAIGDQASVTVRLYAGTATSGTPLQTATVARGAGGAFSMTTIQLANGTYTAIAEQADAAGNIGTSQPVHFTIAVGSGDTTPPIVSLSQPADGTVTGSGTPAFSGVAGTASGDEDAVRVVIFNGSAVGGTTAQTLATVRSPLGTYTVSSAPLADGVYTARTEQRDAAGNTGYSPAATFTVDTQAPSPTLTAPAASATVGPAVTFSGVATTAAGDSQSVTLRLYSGSTATGTPLQLLTTNRQANGSYTVTAPLANGTFTAVATQSDSAGNLGASPATTFSVDAVAPVVTVVAPANGSTVTTATPSVSGTAGTQPGDNASVTIRLYAGTTPTGTPVQTLSAARQAGGTYSTSAAALPNGTFTVQSSQSDAVGNIGLSTARTFTVAVAGGSDPVLIGAGDIAGCGSSTKDDATAAILASNPAATVFTLGDNAYDNGTATEYANCYDPTWGAHKSRTRPTIADHDLGSGTPQPYLNYFATQLAPYGPTATDPTKMYYSYNLGAWHVVHLNAVCFYYTPGCDPAAQEAWLRADLAANANVCTAIMMSSPRFSSGSVHGNNFDMQGYWSAAYEGGADIVLSGDDHIYERFAPMNASGAADATYGVRQFIVGTGGYSLYPLGTTQPNSQFRDNQHFGVIKLTLHASGYDWTFLPIDGLPAVDQGTATCHGKPPVTGPAGAPAIRSTANAKANYASTALTIAKPAGTVAGDLLLATIGHQGGSGSTLTPPAGWTAVPGADASDGTNVRMRAFYRIATASEPASYQFNLSNGMSLAGGIASITGAHPTSPINAAAGRVTSSNSTAITAPSLTTTVANTRVIYAGGINSPGVFDPPTGMSEHWDVTTSGAYNVATEFASAGQAAAGATGTKTANLAQSARGAALLIAIAPAAS